ncbi:MAG: hypothetical protein Q7S76_01650 [bacterium]|nr:hypothetical protein [bacterium]
MQNHLDAETETYYQQIAATIFDENGLKQYFDSNSNEIERKKAEDLLHVAFTFAKHVEDMTPEARLQSEAHLQNLAKGLSVKNELQQEDRLSPPLFLEAVRPFSEERPLVSYEVFDTDADVSVGYIAYETLRDEPLYRTKNKDGFRYNITGMKIVDHGSGFDSQLSALYLSSKTGKRHLRGKFGEGAKMSELHLLRNGAAMKMRSRYTVQRDDATEKSRVWQTRPQVKDGRLVSHGVEVEQEGQKDTGSMVSISLRGANEAFRKDFLDNVDPRLGGLEKNIADFRSQEFSYPMPITEKNLSGVDMSGKGDVQYVQGLRVELAMESFGYGEPWFSYNFLDSSIIAGRDRNEINGGIRDRIKSFWHHVDSHELLEELVRTAVHDSSRSAGGISSSSELSVLQEILTEEGDESKSFPENVQKIVDNALLHELALEKQTHTLVMSSRDRKDKNLADVVSYAEERGYEIKTTASDLGTWVLENFAKRLTDEYKIVTFNDVRDEMRGREPKENEEVVKVVEGEREKAIREVFLIAVTSVNELVSKAGMGPKTFELRFDMSQKVNVGRGRGSYSTDDYGDDGYGYGSNFRTHSRINFPPVALGWADNMDYTVRINPDRISDPRHSDPRALQRQIETYLLSGFAQGEGSGRSREDVLKKSQKVLDELITELIPEDAPVLKALPQQFEYEKDPTVLLRLTESILNELGTEHKKEKGAYEVYRKVLDTHLTSDEAQKIHKSLRNSDSYIIHKILESRVFLDGETLVYYNSKKGAWEKQKLTKGGPVTKWRGLPVYTLNDGRYFIPASMRNGAVLARGEGKKREYTFSEDNNLLHIGQNNIGFGTYREGYGENVVVHPDGLTLLEMSEYRERVSGGEDRSVRKQLEEYTYYPTGTAKREGSIDRGVSRTAIPIEYGQDEWDNPIRIFQDVIQNHIDASEDGEAVQLIYEINRDGNRTSVSESELQPFDEITGLTIQDNGSGYYPNDIATMGASSKKSPLFAGKYGEGQKMVAAAALRNGLELSYESTVKSSKGLQSWRAKAVSEARAVVLGGKEVEKKLVAFDVAPNSARSESGSTTTLRLPLAVSAAQGKQWAKWVSIIDPRQKDGNGHGGLARYVRQLRRAGSERAHTVGSISVLLDEPGAVYENGLRINPQAEKGRLLSFGYDVPEVVTTRERNSYNPHRLEEYMGHAISNISDPEVVEKILHKVANSHAGTPDLDIGVIMKRSENVSPIWAEIAKKVWLGYVVYSSERIHEEIYGSDFMSFGDVDDEGSKEQIERALRIQANIVHLDEGRILDVSNESYSGFSRLLPTAESVIDKLETEVLPVPPAIKKALSRVVAESAKVFADMLKKAKATLADEQLKHFPLREDRFSEWKDAASIENRNAVAIAPISSAFHGKVDEGVVFNEALLLDIEGNRRKLAEVSLHEVAHIVSGHHDYQENFVTLLYELAQYLAKAQQDQRRTQTVRA